ncbi:unnamed protein product [Chironomus riparius]|uniref:Uncharacterized protein n=1 Tax=Chironomus riparius TaxID=315576 RepID=A0A9N9RV35_9DIPT|nr:unnamed protein product [Chironomus riparius]
MSLTKDDSFEMAGNFVRGSKLRKSFRIRHRHNSKLPPSALIYMKSLEKKNSENEINTSTKPSIVGVHLKSDIRKKEDKPIRKITNLTELDESICDDSTPLLRKTSSRNSFKQPTKKYKKKLNKIISFFR